MFVLRLHLIMPYEHASPTFVVPYGHAQRMIMPTFVLRLSYEHASACERICVRLLSLLTLRTVRIKRVACSVISARLPRDDKHQKRQAPLARIKATPCCVISARVKAYLSAPQRPPTQLTGSQQSR